MAEKPESATDAGRVATQPGSRKPDPQAVPALTGFDPSRGTFACPICGEDKPHHHTPVVVDAYQNKRSRK